MAVLMVLAGCLIVRAVLQLHTYDRILRKLKRDHPQLAKILDQLQ